MSQASPEAAHEFTNAALLRVSIGPLTAPVLARVVSMVLARANCPVDRLDDAMVLCDTLAAHAPAYTSDGHLGFRIATRSDSAELRVGELAPEGARKLVKDALIPGVGNVLEHVVDELRFEPAAKEGSEDLVLAFSFR